MKKIILILLLAVLIVTQVFAIETGTVTLSYENGTVIYNDTQTFYEFDVMGYIDGGSDTNVFKEGQFYVEYNTTVFGDSSSLNIVSTTLMGPLATIPGVVYWIVNDGKNTASNAFSVTFEALPDYTSGLFNSETYISASSGAPSTLMHIKLEVIASGSSDIDWPSGIAKINELFSEYDSDIGSDYEGFSFPNAAETTQITYSDTGDPALPIMLRELTAQYEKSRVVLSWTTESETQNLGYVVKRAIKYSDDDMSAYEIIASYQTNDELYGAGTTTEHNTYSYTDKNVKPGINYSYVLEDVDYDGNIVAHDPVTIVIPENLLFENKDFSLGLTYPNPFNPSFTVPFELTRTMDVSINMYDITGKQVMSIVSGTFEARQYQFRVNASDLNSGIYFVRTIIGSEVITQKMTLLK